MKLHTGFNKRALGYTCSLLFAFSTASSAGIASGVTADGTSQQTQAGQGNAAKPADTSPKGLCKCVMKFRIKNINAPMPNYTNSQQNDGSQVVEGGPTAATTTTADTDAIPADNPVIVSFGGKLKLGIMSSKQQCADYIKKIAENGDSNSSSLNKAKFSCKWKGKAMAIPAVSPGAAGQPASAANAANAD